MGRFPPDSTRYKRGDVGRPDVPDVKMGMTSKRAMKYFYDHHVRQPPIDKIPEATEHNEDVFDRLYVPIPAYDDLKK